MFLEAVHTGHSVLYGKIARRALEIKCGEQKTKHAGRGEGDNNNTFLFIRHGLSLSAFRRPSSPRVHGKQPAHVHQRCSVRVVCPLSSGAPPHLALVNEPAQETL